MSSIPGEFKSAMLAGVEPQLKIKTESEKRIAAENHKLKTRAARRRGGRGQRGGCEP